MVSAEERKIISDALMFNQFCLKIQHTHLTRGPRAFYRSPDNQQQTVQSDKRQPEWQDSNKCMCCRQYISMLLWTFRLKEDFVKGSRSPSSTYFCPILDLPLGISGRNHYQNGSIPSKAFCLWSSIWIFLALPWIHPRADLIKKPKNMCVPWELHPYKVS